MLTIRAERWLNAAVLSRAGLVLAKPEFLHGPPSFAGVVGWSRRLMRHFELSRMLHRGGEG